MQLRKWADLIFSIPHHHNRLAKNRCWIIITEQSHIHQLNRHAQTINRTLWPQQAHWEEKRPCQHSNMTMLSKPHTTSFKHVQIRRSMTESLANRGLLPNPALQKWSFGGALSHCQITCHKVLSRTCGNWQHFIHKHPYSIFICASFVLFYHVTEFSPQVMLET